ncbi:small acid-soluble spore protein, H-type [Caminicella sporogenes DSM 14501]|uniref:Small acid-soluble spore protein, H-type n=1 Tax=Caminicella sporogenes DSM 14501 TaxID=1121266 RepID=A0A1M6S566_9FIRM|nr:H-type small acid-soluble spore protein [Caminicella sporogenes]SHK39810.1 small acid-soluble spore protein, H-type [Caminicella sporogenes DSM 14501]
MDIKRAKEILNSAKDIEVTYQGKSVWINSINPSLGSAFIITRDNEKKQYQVSISDLVEK